VGGQQSCANGVDRGDRISDLVSGCMAHEVLELLALFRLGRIVSGIAQAVCVSFIQLGHRSCKSPLLSIPVVVLQGCSTVRV